ncbi:MAG: hypothetical protein OK422_02530 [Thaumarchaeota archaeon]|nr:hypothetical protein [Nitrososphaerota archaeon]
MANKRLEDILRLIALLQDVQHSSANPFDVDILDKILVLKKHLPDWEFLDDLLLDSQALVELSQVVKLQDQWLKHRASSLYIDPLLVQLKVKLLPKNELAAAFVKSWHPLAQIDQLSPQGLERAFVYWRDLAPMSERFKDQFGSYGTRPGIVDYQDLVDLKIFTQDQFETRLNSIDDELKLKSGEEWIDYRDFVKGKSVDETILRSYILAFLISEGRAVIQIDPLSNKISVAWVNGKATGEAKSVAIPVGDQ